MSTKRQRSTATVYWYGQAGIRAMGWQGIAGLLLLVATIAVYFMLLVPQRLDLAELRQSASDLRQKTSPQRGQITQGDAVTELAQFYAFFPKDDGIPDAMAHVFDAATKQGLVLEQGEYRFVAEASSQFHRYDLVLPVKGNYVSIRRFIAQMLKENPNAALLGVSFNRQGVADTMLDAQLHMALYLRVGE